MIFVMALAFFKLFDYLFGAPNRDQDSPDVAGPKMQTRSTTAASRAAARITNADMLQKIKCWTCGSFVPLAAYFQHLEMKSESERKGYIPCLETGTPVRASFSIIERSSYAAQLPFEAREVITAIQQSFACRGVTNDDMELVQFDGIPYSVLLSGGDFAPTWLDRIHIL